MIEARRMAVGFLAGGLALALGVPTYLALSSPRLSGMLGQRVLLLWQPVPYLVCGALWLPWGSDRAARAGRGLAGLLFAVSLALYGSMLLRPERLSGDMVGLGFILIGLVLTGGVVVLSFLVRMAWWVKSRRVGPAARPSQP
jgi:hypothetical protein